MKQFWRIDNELKLSPTSPTVQIWVFICREWSPTIAEIWDASEKIETLPIFPIWLRTSQTIGDAYDVQFPSLGRSGNSVIPDRLGFSQHMKTRLFNKRMDRMMSANRALNGSFHRNLYLKDLICHKAQIKQHCVIYGRLELAWFV